MKFSTWILSAVLGMATLAQSAPARANYDGVKVMRIDLGESKEDAEALQALVNKLNLPMWTDVITPNTHIDVEVPKNRWSAFVEGTQNFNVSIMHEDLGESIRQESEGSEFRAAAADITFFNNYHAYSEHLTFLNDLVAQYPSRAEIVTAGNSYQGRPITGIHIFGSAGKGNRPAIVFHGTVHAREWITTMVNQYFAFWLLSNYATDSTIKGFVDKYDFYIFPVVNPDGFVYSQSTERLWRKNRQPTSGSSCIGHDINRNWDRMWNVAGGASTNPCAQDFKGLSPGDTPEYKALSSFQNRLAQSTVGAKMYVDWHSYSQLFMTPYGYSCSALPADNTELISLARGAASAIQSVYGTRFQTGPICPTIYQATGSSVDYAYDVSKIKYSFTAELRDTGNYGFVLPANQILPSARETWAAVDYLLKNIK